MSKLLVTTGLLLALVSGLSACGKTGDLYLPDDKAKTATSK